MGRWKIFWCTIALGCCQQRGFVCNSWHSSCWPGRSLLEEIWGGWNRGVWKLDTSGYFFSLFVGKSSHNYSPRISKASSKSSKKVNSLVWILQNDGLNTAERTLKITAYNDPTIIFVRIMCEDKWRPKSCFSPLCVCPPLVVSVSKLQYLLVMDNHAKDGVLQLLSGIKFKS